MADLSENGVLSDVFSSASIITADDAASIIGNIWTGTAPNTDPLSLIALYPSKLPSEEIAMWHAASQSRITPRKQWPGGGLDIPTLTGTAREPKFIDNFQTARVTLADEVGPSTQFSNTGLNITSGTFSHREDDVGRYAYCVGAGTLRRRLIGADTFTTDLFIEEGGATIAKDATGFDLVFGAGDIVRAVRLVA